MTVRQTAAARPMSWPAPKPSRSASTVGSCRPTSRKASPFTTKISICHTDAPKHARSRLQDARRPIPDEQSGRDDREHAGEAQPLGRDVGGERGQQADEDLHRRVVDEADELRGAPADEQPEDRPTDGDHHEAHRRLAKVQRAGAGRGADRGDDGEAVHRQRRRVVHEALALEDDHEPAREVQPPGDRRGRDRVGRGDDGTERHRHRPAQLGHQGNRHDRDRDRRGDHEPDGQQA